MPVGEAHPTKIRSHEGITIHCARSPSLHKDHTMSRHRKSFTEKRRARQAMKSDRLDRLEPRSMITEPASLLGLATGSLRGMVQLGLMQADGGKACSPWHGSLSRRSMD